MENKFKRVTIIQDNGDKVHYTPEDFEEVMNKNPEVKDKFQGDVYKMAIAFLQFHIDCGNKGYIL